MLHTLCSFGRTRQRQKRILRPSPVALLNRVTPAHRYRQLAARQGQLGVQLVATIAPRLAPRLRRDRTGRRQVHRHGRVVPRGCCGLPGSMSSGSRRRPTPWRSAPEQEGHVCASVASGRAGTPAGLHSCHGAPLPPPGTAPTTGHRAARCKVTNLLLIPPGAPLFRPCLPRAPLPWSSHRDEHVGSVQKACMCWERARVPCAGRACQGLHGACRVCMEHAERAQSMQRAETEHMHCAEQAGMECAEGVCM